MNNILISGKVLTSPKQICKYNICQNQFFNLLTNCGVVCVGIHNNLARSINLNDTIFVSGTLNKFINNDVSVDSKYNVSSFVYIDAYSITPFTKPINKLKIEGEIIKQTYISGAFSLLQLKVNADNIFVIPCQIDNTNSYKQNVIVEGRLSPCMLDNNKNIEYIILANKITKNKEITKGSEVSYE